MAMADKQFYCSRCGEPVHPVEDKIAGVIEPPIWRHTKSMFITCDDGVLPDDVEED